MNLSTKQKDSHTWRLAAAKGDEGGEAWSGGLGLADANYYI